MDELSEIKEVIEFFREVKDHAEDVAGEIYTKVFEDNIGGYYETYWDFRYNKGNIDVFLSKQKNPSDVPVNVEFEFPAKLLMGDRKEVERFIRDKKTSIAIENLR